jgi:tetratricopeptide (TPR) repeat protein
MSLKDRADYVIRTGRLQYFMGQYPMAAKSFAEAAPLYLELKDWEGAAKALFNAGACIQNSGNDDADAATAMVEKCRKLSLEHNLWGPLSHCEAFYGVECYNQGLFSSAKDHFRRAMTVIPVNDKSFRRLHILSFLSLTYFAMGRYSLAIKFGRQTLELAATDTSDRFKTRYMALEAEILWEEGKISESMSVLKKAVHQLSLHGVHNLEELSTVSRYQIQLAILGEVVTEKIKIDESLQKKQESWLEYQYSCALMQASSNAPSDLDGQLHELVDQAKKCGSLQYQALSLLAMIRVFLQRGQIESAQKILPQLECAVSRIGDTPIRAKLQCIYSAIAYQSGDFEGAVKHLHAVDKMSAVSWADKFAVQACLATIRGESPRFQNEWQEKIVARFVRGYFAPTIKFGDKREVVISGRYRVSLEKHPAMSDLLVYLSERVPHGATLAEVQQHVWKESLNAQGWQQKIRNSVMRLRDLFPYTIAPIIVHGDSLRFFGEAIRVLRDHADGDSIETQVRNMLREGPLSSQNLADSLEISLATAKRALKKMVDDHQLQFEKSGRNVVYKIAADRSGLH